jgi:hypothetical protein
LIVQKYAVSHQAIFPGVAKWLRQPALCAQRFVLLQQGLANSTKSRRINVLPKPVCSARKIASGLLVDG